MGEGAAPDSRSVVCAGAPRDLGFDQGRAGEAAVRSAVAELGALTRLAARVPIAALDSVSEQVARDLDRHFPHMAERTSGLARGAGVARGELVALLARERRDAPHGGPAASKGLLVAVAPERGGDGALIVRAVVPAAAVRRESAPDNDFRSWEVAAPWLVPALGGVNEHGLAVAGAALAPRPGSFEACGAPALLLVQDCLQRFDTVQKAIEWCQARPAGGGVSILLADAGGDVAEVVVAGEERWVRRPSDGVLIGADAGARGQAVAKALGDRARVDAEALREILDAHPGLGPSRSVVFDPALPQAGSL